MLQKKRNTITPKGWLFLSFLFFSFFFRAAPEAYGGSQARGRIGATAAIAQQRQIQAVSATYTTALGNARSLTQWEGPGIEPTTSWFLVRFVSAVPR